MIHARAAGFFLYIAFALLPMPALAVDFQCQGGAQPINCAIGAEVKVLCKEHCPAQQNEEVKADTSSQSNTSSTNNPNEGLECDTARFQGIAGAGGGISGGVKCWKAGIRGGVKADKCVVKGITCQSLEQKAQDAMKGPKPTQGQPGTQSGEAANPDNYQQQLENYRNNYLKDEIAQQRADDAWYAQQSDQFKSDMFKALDQAYLDNVSQGAQDMIRQSGSPRNLIGTLSEWANFNSMVSSGQLSPQQLFDYMGQQGLESYDLGMLQRNAPLSNIPGEQVFSGARNLIRPAGTFNNSGGANPFALPTSNAPSNPWQSVGGPQPATGNLIGEALVSAQEAAANAWQSVKDFAAGQWEKAMAVLTPSEEALPGAGLPDSPNMTPEQELPGIEVVQTPDVPVTGLPQNVTELAEMLDSSQVAEEVRSSYVNEILGSKEQGWVPSSDQYKEAIGIVESTPDDRGMFARTMDRFINYSDRAQTLARLNSGLQEASRAEALGILSSNASGLAANGQMAALPEFSDASVQELLETTPEGARVSAASQRANDKALALQSTSANLKEIAGNAIDVRDQLRARVDQLAALEAMGVRDIPEGDVNSLLRETSDQLKTVNSNLERMLDGSDPAFEKQMYDAVQARAQVNEMFGFGTLLYKPIFGGEAGLRDLGLFISDPAAWREGVIANATAQVVTQSVDQANNWTLAGGFAGALPVAGVLGKTTGIAAAQQMGIGAVKVAGIGSVGNPLGSAFDGVSAAGRTLFGSGSNTGAGGAAAAARAADLDFNPAFADDLSGAESRFANAYTRSAREAVQAEVASGTVAPEAFERAVYNRLHNSMGKTDFVTSGNGRNVMNALESEMRARGIVPEAGFTPAPRPVVVPDAGSSAPLPNNRAISVSSRPASQSPFSTRPRAAAEIPPVAAGLPASGLSAPAAAFTSLPTRFSQALSNVGDAVQGAVQSVRRVAAPVALSVGMLTNPLPPIPVAGIDVPIVSSVTPAQGAPASQATLPVTVEIDGIKGVESGAASTYNPAKPGWRTGETKLATGARYNPKAYEAALQTDLAAKYQMGHGNYPRNGFALVEQGDKKLIVKINDNGPLVPGRIIDLNEASMRYLSNNKYGNNSGVLNDVKVTVLEGTGYTPGPVDGSATLVARVETASPPNTVSAQTATVPPVQNVVVTPDELASRSLTANIPPRAPVGTPQLEAINPLNEVDDFFGRIFTPTEQGVKDIVNQVIKQNPYVPRTKLAAQVLKEQSSAVGTSAYKKLRDNVARELAGRRDGQGGVSAAEAARADAEIGRQLAVLNGELQPQRTIGEVAKATGRPEIPGLEGKGHFMVPLQAPETLPKRVAIIMHQTEGSYAVGHARAQMSRPNKVGTTIWVERDGTFYWAAPESANPKHIRSGSSLRGDNKYIDNSQTRGVITSENTIGIEFAGNPPGRLQNPLTAEQLDTAAKLGRFLQERYNIPSDKVYAHSWVQHKAESSARVADRYVEGAAAANVVRMLGYRPGIDSAADFTSVSDRALVNTAVANLPAGGPLDSTVRTALRDMGDGVLVAENVAVPDAPAAAITDVAFNRVSPFSAAPQSGEELVRNFTTPSALEATSPLNVRPSPVLVSEPKPIAQPSAPTQVAVNEPARTPGSAAEPRGFSPLDLIEVPIAIGNAPTWVANRIADAGSYIRTALVGPTVPESPRGIANTPSSGQVVASNEPGVPVRTPENTEILPSPTGQSLEPVAPTALAESRPIAIARVPLTEGEVIRPTTPTSIALNPSNRLGNEIVQVAERPVQIASKTVRVEDISGADATAVASADVKGALAGVEAAEARAVAAKVFLAELDTSKKLADNVNRLMSAYFNQGKVLDPQSLSSAIQKSVAQVNRFERAIADAEALGALDAATAARVRELFEPVKSTSQLLETQRPQLMRLVPNSHGKVSLGATFGVDGAAEGLQAIKTTPARLSDSLAERQALETAARSGAEKTIAAADVARAEAKRLAEAEQLRLVEEARIAEARAAQIVNQEGPVAYVPSATPGTWTSADVLAAPKGPFEVSITRVSDTPNTPQGPADLPGQEPGVPSGRTPTIAREEEIDPALNPPPLPRQDPELPFPENTGARPDGEISPTLTTGGGPITPAIADEGLISRTRNALSDAFARARFNTQVGWSRLTGSGRPAEVSAPLNDSFAQRLDAWSRSEGSRLERMQELATLREALQARQQIVARNAADLAAATPEPQSGIPSVRDTELANMNKEMSTALTRGDESIQDLVRAEEALAKNTPEGDAEARALAASGLDKVRERAAAESRALTIARANTEVPADDMIGRLGQWEARYGGAAQAASDGGSGGAGGTTGGSGAAAADDAEPSRATRIANALCLGGRVRQFICGALGFTGVVMTYQQVTVDGAPQETQKDATNFNGIPVKDDTSVIFQIPPGGGTPVPAPTPDDSSDTTSSDAPRQPAPDPRTDTPRPDPSVGRDLGSGGPIAYGGYGPAGSSGGGGGFFGGGMNMLSGLFQGLMQWFTGGDEEEGDQSRPQQPSQPASEPPVGAIVGNPQVIDDGDTTTLSWSTVGTDVSSSTCAIVTSDFAVFARGGQNGSINSGALSESTRFGLVCNVKGAQDKLLNETLIRVRGDDTDPPRIFTDEQIAASQASQSNPVRPTSQNSSAQQGSNDGSSNNPTPQDVRTCDPEQAMDSFIKCLCEAEPNPRGCSVPPGGTR